MVHCELLHELFFSIPVAISVISLTKVKTFLVILGNKSLRSVTTTSQPDPGHAPRSFPFPPDLDYKISKVHTRLGTGGESLNTSTPGVYMEKITRALNRLVTINRTARVIKQVQPMLHAITRTELKTFNRDFEQEFQCTIRRSLEFHYVILTCLWLKFLFQVQLWVSR